MQQRCLVCLWPYAFSASFTALAGVKASFFEAAMVTVAPYPASASH